jgi:hypothetical protein
VSSGSRRRGAASSHFIGSFVCPTMLVSCVAFTTTFHADLAPLASEWHHLLSLNLAPSYARKVCLARVGTTMLPDYCAV